MKVVVFYLQRFGTLCMFGQLLNLKYGAAVYAWKLIP